MSRPNYKAETGGMEYREGNDRGEWVKKEEPSSRKEKKGRMSKEEPSSAKGKAIRSKAKKKKGPYLAGLMPN